MVIFPFKVRVWLGSGEMPSDAEEALLLWINRSVLAIKDFIQNNNAHEHNLVRGNKEEEKYIRFYIFILHYDIIHVKIDGKF